MIDAAFTGLEPVTSAKTACRLLGKARATLYRQRNPAPPAEGRGRRVAHPAALSAAERTVLLAVLDGDRFADKSPAQAWAILLDEGTYLASISTMYRVLRAEAVARAALRPPHRRQGPPGTGRHRPVPGRSWE